MFNNMKLGSSAMSGSGNSPNNHHHHNQHNHHNSLTSPITSHQPFQHHHSASLAQPAQPPPPPPSSLPPNFGHLFGPNMNMSAAMAALAAQHHQNSLAVEHQQRLQHQQAAELMFKAAKQHFGQASSAHHLSLPAQPSQPPLLPRHYINNDHKIGSGGEIDSENDEDDEDEDEGHHNYNGDEQDQEGEDQEEHVGKNSISPGFSVTAFKSVSANNNNGNQCLSPVPKRQKIDDKLSFSAGSTSPNMPFKQPITAHSSQQFMSQFTPPLGSSSKPAKTPSSSSSAKKCDISNIESLINNDKEEKQSSSPKPSPMQTTPSSDLFHSLMMSQMSQAMSGKEGGNAVSSNPTANPNFLFYLYASTLAGNPNSMLLPPAGLASMGMGGGQDYLATVLAAQQQKLIENSAQKVQSATSHPPQSSSAHLGRNNRAHPYSIPGNSSASAKAEKTASNHHKRHNYKDANSPLDSDKHLEDTEVSLSHEESFVSEQQHQNEEQVENEEHVKEEEHEDEDEDEEKILDEKINSLAREISQEEKEEDEEEELVNEISDVDGEYDRSLVPVSDDNNEDDNGDSDDEETSRGKQKVSKMEKKLHFKTKKTNIS